MVRLFVVLCFFADSFPRGRGDGPENANKALELATFSPRAWGWSGEISRSGRKPFVFPARVGMVQSELRLSGNLVCYPRGRGDDPS